MAYVTTENDEAYRPVDTGKAVGAGVGLYTAFGVGIMLLALAAAAFITENPTQDPTSGSALVTSLAIGVLPIIAAPILAVVVGLWTGVALRQTGAAAWTAAVGTLIGAIVMFVLVAIGLALGAAIGGVPSPDVTQGGPAQGFQFDNPADLQFFTSVVGITYLVVHLIIAAIAGAFVAWALPRLGVGRPVVEEETTRGPTRI